MVTCDYCECCQAFMDEAELSVCPQCGQSMCSECVAPSNTCCASCAAELADVEARDE